VLVSETALILLDLDGLLVRTEELHFAAYCQACAAHGVALLWDFPTYCRHAHSTAAGIRLALEEELAQLFRAGLAWEDLYEEKCRVYTNMLSAREVSMQPGAEDLFEWLEVRGLPWIVVTNSPRDQCDALRQRLPALRRIPAWVTREEYSRPKPAPDAYVTALERTGVDRSAALGVEDTPRGVAALAAAGITAALVSAFWCDLAETAPLLCARYSSLVELLGDLSVAGCICPTSSGSAMR